MKAKTGFSLLNRKPDPEAIFFYSLLFFLPTQLGKHFWPPFSYLLGIRSDYLSPTVFITDVILLLLLLSFLFRWQKSREKRRMGPAVIVWGIIFAFCFVSSMINNTLLLGLYADAKLGEYVFFGYYLKQQLFQRYSLFSVAIVLGVGSILESVLAIGQFLTQGSLNGIWYWLGERTFTSQTIGIANMSLDGILTLRPYGTFSHPNVLAAYLLTLCPLFLSSYLFSQSRRNGWKKVFLFCFLLSSITLFISYSRVAIVGWIFTTGVILSSYLPFSPKKKNLFFLSGFFLMILLCVIWLVLQLSSRFSSLVDNTESVTQRISLVLQSLVIIKSHIIFGVSLYNFLPVLARSGYYPVSFFALQPVHNIFLLIASELGIPGFLLFCFFLYMTMNKLYVNRKKGWLVVVCLLFLFQIVYTGMFDHYWFTLQQGQLLLSFVFGFCWAVIRLCESDSFWKVSAEDE